MVRLLSIAFLCVFWAQLSAYQSTDAFLKELDGFLTPKQMAKIIGDNDAAKIAVLAENEDLEIADHYLVSDELLRLLRRGGVLNTELGKKLEDFQSEIDRLEKPQRDLAIAKWKALWLDKAAAYLRHVRSLKRLWAIDLNQTLDYDDNVLLGDPGDPTTITNSGRDDFGMTLAGGITLRPCINMPKKRNWNWRVNLNGSSRMQSKEESLEYETVGLRNSISWSNISALWKSLAFSHEYRGTTLKSSTDSKQHIFNLNTRFYPMTSNLWGFGNGINRVSIAYRIRGEDETSIDIGTATASNFQNLKEKVQTFSLTYGQNFMKLGKGSPFQTFGWSLKYESQSPDYARTRDSSYFDLGLNYTRALPNLSSRYNINWNNRMSFRLREWDTESATNETEQQQFSLNTALNARWNPNFSTNFSLSYMVKKSDVNDVARPWRSPTYVNQWRFAISNSFLTF
jgi:hypothetical protein